MVKFNKSQRSGWRYYWAHWFAFQMVAVTLGVWKIKYLFHDWYKPWLKMFGIPYSKIQKYHRYSANHHLEYLEKYHDPTKFDWEAMIIDWECSRYTKEASPRNARQEYEYLMENLPNDDMSKTKKYFLYHYVEPKLKSLGL